MVPPTAKSSLVGALSITYGILISAFWACVYLTHWLTHERSDVDAFTFLIIPFIAAPVLLVATGFALCSQRIGEADARTLKLATVAMLAAKAAIAGYWAFGLITASGNFSSLLHPLGWRVLALEVIPSAV